MREAAVQKAICDYLTMRRIPWVRTNAGRVAGVRLAPKGFPDLVACYKGRFVGIEVKGEGGTATTEQLLCLRDLEDAGAVTCVAWSVEDVMRSLSASEGR